jgi:hypothetical protein
MNQPIIGPDQQQFQFHQRQKMPFAPKEGGYYRQSTEQDFKDWQISGQKTIIFV